MSRREPPEEIVWLDDDGAPQTHADEMLAEPDRSTPGRRRVRIALLALALIAIGAGIGVAVSRDHAAPSAAPSRSLTPTLPPFEPFPSSQRTFALEPTTIVVPDLPGTPPSAMLKAVRQYLPHAKAGAPVAQIDEHGATTSSYTFMTASRQLTIEVVEATVTTMPLTRNPSDYETVVTNVIGRLHISVDLRRRDGVPLTGRDLAAAKALSTDIRLTQ